MVSTQSGAFSGVAVRFEDIPVEGILRAQRWGPLVLRGDLIRLPKCFSEIRVEHKDVSNILVLPLRSDRKYLAFQVFLLGFHQRIAVPKDVWTTQTAAPWTMLLLLLPNGSNRGGGPGRRIHPPSSGSWDGRTGRTGEPALGFRSVPSFRRGEMDSSLRGEFRCPEVGSCQFHVGIARS